MTPASLHAHFPKKGKKMTIVSSPFLSATFHLRRPPSLSPLPCISKPSSSSSSILFIRCCSSSSSSSSMESEKKKKQRVVVCGGGVIGVCTAYFLAKKGTASVILVEKSSIACAASGKAGGFLALDWCDGGPLSNLARASFNLHRSLSLEFDGPQAYGYRPLDTLALSITEGDETSKEFTSASIVPGWVDGPVRNPNTIGTIETTAQVHPQLFTRTLVSSAVANHGLEVVIGELDSVEVDEGGRVEGVLLKEGRIIEADSVVLALGPWSSRLPLVSSLFRVFGIKAHSIVLEPREPSAITPHALALSYLQRGNREEPLDPELEVYPRPTGEVYVCGMSSESEVPDDPEEIVGDPESIKVLKRMAGMVSSHLREGEANVKAEQACFLPCTNDSVPVIGELPNVKGCYVATGHNSWGILNGPATGAAMAELVLDGSSSIVDLTPFSPSRFLGTRRKH